jgi:LacI family transcriptional regulator
VGAEAGERAGSGGGADKPAHRIREIAARAGVSAATVDRVLHHRGGVRDSTVADVLRAIAELDGDRQAPGPTIRIDVIGPLALRTALEAELPGLWPAVVQAQFHHGDSAAALAKVVRSRSQGLIIQASVSPSDLKIPTVTLPAWDDAGATAAYLVEQWLADRAGDVLIVGGESDPRSGTFHRAMAEHRRLRVAPDVDAVRALLDDNPSVRAIYSFLSGAANTAIVEAFLESHRNYDVFVGNELDKENAELLRAHRISAVLHRDLRGDLRRACLALLRARPEPVRTAIQVITPFNLPADE